MTEKFSPDLAPASRAPKATEQSLADEFEELSNDFLLAIGALSAIPNELMQRIGQSLHDKRMLLAALYELGNKHPDELIAAVQRNRGQ